MHCVKYFLKANKVSNLSLDNNKIACIAYKFMPSQLRTKMKKKIASFDLAR